MTTWLVRISVLTLPLVLTGCCYFFPCHPATYIAGTVTDAVSHQPIADAAVQLYFYETHTMHAGCFALGGADAQPFEFSVSAHGYKPITVRPKPGSYRATVTLRPEQTAGPSNVNFQAISPERYADMSIRCQ